MNSAITAREESDAGWGTTTGQGRKNNELAVKRGQDRPAWLPGPAAFSWFAGGGLLSIKNLFAESSVRSMLKKSVVSALKNSRAKLLLASRRSASSLTLFFDKKIPYGILIQQHNMANEKPFVAALKKQIQSERLTLPVFDAVSLRIHMELIKKEPSFRVIEKLILADQALSSNLLKIANSARYSGMVETTTIKSAILRIGMSEITQIVSAEVSKKAFHSRDVQMAAIAKKLWQHSLGCAFAAGLLSSRLDFGVMQNEAFFTGLFHDIGKLLILKVIAEKKRENRSVKVSDELLLDAMDTLHAEQGYLLMQQIKMPEKFAVITRDHHLQDFDRDNYLLALVRMANLVCHFMGIGLVQDSSIALLETEEAVLLKLSEADLEALQDFMNSTPALAD